MRPKIPRHLTLGSNLLLKCLESFSVHPDRTSVLELNRSQKLSVVLIVIFLCSSHEPQSFRQCPQIQSQFFRVILTSSACPKEHGSTESCHSGNKSEFRTFDFAQTDRQSYSSIMHGQRCTGGSVQGKARGANTPQQLNEHGCENSIQNRPLN